MGILGCRGGDLRVVGVQWMWGLVGWQCRGLRIVWVGGWGGSRVCWSAGPGGVWI